MLGLLNEVQDKADDVKVEVDVLRRDLNSATIERESLRTLVEAAQSDIAEMQSSLRAMTIDPYGARRGREGKPFGRTALTGIILGSGKDGALTVSSGTTRTSLVYALVVDASAGDTVVVLDSCSGLSADDEVGGIWGTVQG